MIDFAAKDVFAPRAYRCSASATAMSKKIRPIKRGEKLSPILLCRNTANAKVIIADRDHRLCAVYTFDEDAMIPCEIV